MEHKYFKINPASYLVLIKNNKILMLRRFNTGFYDGKYSLVAGRSNINENFTKTIMREAKEEANIILRRKDLKVVHIMNRYEKRNKPDLRERVDVFFAAKKWRGAIKNMEPDKCSDLQWFPLNKLPGNTIPCVKFAIKNIQKNIFYSEFGYKNK